MNVEDILSIKVNESFFNESSASSNSGFVSADFNSGVVILKPTTSKEDAISIKELKKVVK